MDKRYQVFISSTYTDLTEERQQVIQTLLQMDCIPTGMELFPAADEEQFDFIKKIIDDCDYYVLIIGGRYGSTTVEGISYTEMEFDYAVKRGIHVIALIHGAPDNIPAGKSELNQEARNKLDAFREKVCKDRLIKKWTTSGELPGLVALSLTRAIKAYPAVGWVRANAVSNTELLEQINELRKRNDELNRELNSRPKVQRSVIENLAKFDEYIELKGIYKTAYKGYEYDWKAKVTWNQIIAFIGPHLLKHVNEDSVNSQLAKTIIKQMNINNKPYTHKVEEETFQTIKIQLMAFGWVEIKPLTTVSNSIALFWILTESGKTQMLRLRTVKSIESTN